ncbi:hypothetical protein HMPREF9095_1435 [Haemophilus aegyptius ATCC 11116]|nr:hypothetical protein HMPREF9095_1435 [Haemophilus aegyptius ATCC 11116]
MLTNQSKKQRKVINVQNKGFFVPYHQIFCYIVWLVEIKLR